MVRLLIFTLAFFTCLSMAFGQKTFKALNSSGQLVFELEIAEDDSRSDGLTVWRNVSEITSSTSRQALGQNPVYNLSDLRFPEGGFELEIPQGEVQYFFVPFNINESVIELEAGDKLRFDCAYGDTLHEGTTECVGSYTTGPDGREYIYCEMTGDYGSICQSFVQVFDANGEFKVQTVTGGILLESSSVRPVNRRTAKQ